MKLLFLILLLLASISFGQSSMLLLMDDGISRPKNIKLFSDTSKIQIAANVTWLIDENGDTLVDGDGNYLYTIVDNGYADSLRIFRDTATVANPTNWIASMDYYAVYNDTPLVGIYNYRFVAKKGNLFSDTSEVFSGTAYAPIVNPTPPSTDLELYFVGDQELTTSGWGDQSGNNRDMTFYNAPTITENAINGISGVLFNGTNEYGKTGNFTLNHPLFIYMMIKPIVNTSGRYIADGTTETTMIISFRGGTSWRLTTNVGNSANNTELTVGSYQVLRADFNGNSSKLQINNGTINVGFLSGSNNPGGFTLAGSQGGLALANIEVACILVYSSAPDDTAVKEFFTSKFGLP